MEYLIALSLATSGYFLSKQKSKQNMITDNKIIEKKKIL